MVIDFEAVTDRFALAFKVIGAVVLVLALRLPPIEIEPPEAVTAIPRAPFEVIAPVGLADNALMTTLPFATIAPEPVYAPVPVIVTSPVPVVVSDALFVIAPPVMSILPTTETVPAESVMSEVLVNFPMRKLAAPAVTFSVLAEYAPANELLVGS